MKKRYLSLIPVLGLIALFQNCGDASFESPGNSVTTGFEDSGSGQIIRIPGEVDATSEKTTIGSLEGNSFVMMINVDGAAFNGQFKSSSFDLSRIIRKSDGESNAKIKFDGRRVFSDPLDMEDAGDYEILFSNSHKIKLTVNVIPKIKTYIAQSQVTAAVGSDLELEVDFMAPQGSTFKWFDASGNEFVASQQDVILVQDSEILIEGKSKLLLTNLSASDSGDHTLVITSSEQGVQQEREVVINLSVN